MRVFLNFALCGLFAFCLFPAKANAQRSVAAICVADCQSKNPDINGQAYLTCVATYCAGADDNRPTQTATIPNLPNPPRRSIASTGAWSVVGFEERTAVVSSAQGGTSLSYSCDGRGGFYIGIAGPSREDRIIGFLFDNGAVHYPQMSNQPTGFQIGLWDDHPLIQAIRGGSAVRLVERNGRIIGDYSLRNSTRAISGARSNC